MANHIMDRCRQYTMEATMTGGDPLRKTLCDFTFMFNVYSFTSYFTKEFVAKHPDIKVNKINTKKFIEEWETHLKTVVSPMFLEEVEKIKKKFEKPKTDMNEIYA